jgi:hypothetical protein
MKLLVFMSIFSISLLSQAKECTLDVVKSGDALKWSSSHGENKFLLIRNLDNDMIYPQMLTTTTSGSLSSKLLEPNKKGYKILLADVTENTKNAIDSLLIDCSKKKNCSMMPKDIKLNQSECKVVESDVLK